MGLIEQFATSHGLNNLSNNAIYFITMFVFQFNSDNSINNTATVSFNNIINNASAQKHCISNFARQDEKKFASRM